MINRAFICYRRSDAGATARWLRAKLSTFSPPDAWVAALPDSTKAEIALGGEYYIDRIGEIPDPGFWKNTILPALRQSEYLIVLSSPAALEPAPDGKKNWVVREIEAFLEIHKESAPSRIIVALAPGASIDRLPGPLNDGAADRAWVDLRQVKLASWMGPGTVVWRLLRLGDIESRHDALIRLSTSLSAGAAESSERALRQSWARLFSIDPGRRASLYQIDARQRAWMRRLGAAALAMFVVVLTAALGAATWSWMRSIEERDAALRSQSRLLAREADNLVGDGDYGTALALALEALPRDMANPSRPYVIEAEVALQALVRRNFRERFSLAGHKKGLVNAAFSPKGNLLMTASWDGKTQVWNADTGQPHGQPMDANSERLRSAKFSHDGERLVTTAGNFAFVWKSSGDAKPVRLEGHNDFVVDASFSHDGRRVVTTSYDRTARLWNAHDGKRLEPEMSHPLGATKAVFSPDDQRILTVGLDNTAYVWQVGTDKPPRKFRHSKQVTEAAFSHDGLHLLTASDGVIRRWDLSKEGDAPALTFDNAGEKTFSGFTLSPVRNSTLMVTRSYGGGAGLWDYVTGSRARPLVGEDGRVEVATLSPDGSLALTMSTDGSARLWNVASGKSVAVLRTDQPSYSSAIVGAFAPDGSKVVTAWENGGTQLWEITTGMLLATLPQHPGRVNSLAFSSDGKTLLTASDDRKARLWIVGEKWTPHIVAEHRGKVNSAVFSPDGAHVLTASSDLTAQISPVAGPAGREPPLGHRGAVAKAVQSAERIVTVYDGDACRWPPRAPFNEECLKTHELRVNDLALSHDSRYFLTGSDDHSAKLWDASTGKYAGRTYRHDRAVTSVAFSRDRKMVLTGSEDWTAQLWDAQPERVRHRLGGHGGSLDVAIFSPDETRILTVASGAGHLWDVATGTRLAQLHGPEGLQRAAFSRDGRRIASSSDGKDSPIRLWRNFATTQELIDHACSIMPRPLSKEQRKRFFVELEPQDPPCGWHPDTKDKPAYTPLDKSQRSGAVRSAPTHHFAATGAP